VMNEHREIPILYKSFLIPKYQEAFGSVLILFNLIVLCWRTIFREMMFMVFIIDCAFLVVIVFFYFSELCNVFSYHFIITNIELNAISFLNK
jgi:hypothetical protein